MKSLDTSTCDLTRWTGTWVLDPQKTTVTFRTKVMWVLPVKGTAKALGGDAQVSLDGAVHGTLIIDAASFTTKNKKRDEHLRSDDILGVVKYPTIVFIAYEAHPSGSSGLEVAGVLTLHGRSQRMTMQAQVDGTDDSVTVSTKVEIERGEWGVTWPGAAKMGAGLMNHVAIRAHFGRAG
jgi:polyisoprenoid-binding protein YceI